MALRKSFIYLFLWLCWVFVAVCRLSLVAMQGLLIAMAFCCRAAALGAQASVAVLYGLSCSKDCGIFHGTRIEPMSHELKIFNPLDHQWSLVFLDSELCINNIVLIMFHRKKKFTFFMLISLLFPYRINLNSLKENRHVRRDTKTLSWIMFDLITLQQWFLLFSASVIFLRATLYSITPSKFSDSQWLSCPKKDE